MSFFIDHPVPTYLPDIDSGLVFAMEMLCSADCWLLRVLKREIEKE